MKKCVPVVWAAIAMMAWHVSVLAAGQPLAVVEVRGLVPTLQAAARMARMNPNSMEWAFVQQALYPLLLANPQNSGIAPNGKIHAFLYMDEDGGDFGIVGMIPLAGDGSTYMANLNMVAPRLPTDDLPEGMVYRAPGIYMLRKGNRVFLSNQSDAILNTMQLIQSGSVPRELPTGGQIAVQITGNSIPRLQQLFPMPGTDGTTQAMSDAQRKIIEQVESETLGIGLAGNVVTFYGQSKYVKGSVFDAYWKKSGQLSGASSFAIPENALFGFAMATPDAVTSRAKYSIIMDYQVEAALAGMAAGLAVSPDMDMDTSELSVIPQKIAGFLGKLFELSMSEFTLSMMAPTPDAPVQLLSYSATGDPEGQLQARRELITEFRALTSELSSDVTETDQGEVVQFAEKLPREFRGIPIKRAVLTFLDGDADRAEKTESGTDVSIDTAILKGGLLESIGESKILRSALVAHLDKTGKPLTERAFWKALFPAPKANLSQAGYVHLFEALSLLFESPQVQVHPEVAKLARDFKRAGKGTVVMADYAQDGAQMSEIAFSLRDLHAVIDIGSKYLADMMGAMMAPSGPPPGFEMENMDFEMMELQFE